MVRGDFVERIGLIGLGPIGSHFLKLLLNDGYSVTVLDLIPEYVQGAVNLGAKAADTPAQVAQSSDVIVLSLPGNKPVIKVMEGEDGILEVLKEGQIVIDTGTSSPDLDQKYETLCTFRGAGFIDSPVTWRKPGLILMVGGVEEVFKRAEKIIACMSYKHKHIGPIGRGQVLKSVNQMVFSNMSALWAEAVEYSRMNGVGKELLVDFLEMAVPDRLFGDDFTRKSGTVELNYKDLLYVQELAHETGANIPLTNAVHEIFKYIVNKGDGKLDQNGIIKYWRSLNGY